MTDYSVIDFKPVTDAASDEVVTVPLVNDVSLASGSVLALITLDNQAGLRRPNTLGPKSLKALNAALDELQQRASAGEIQAIAVTGKPGSFAAGADLALFSEVNSDYDRALLLSQLGHFVLGKLKSLGVPSFAFVNATALGGGMEVALNCDYRTVSSNAKLLGFPEVHIGLIPGWGGSTILPKLLGIKNAIELVVSNPLKNNRLLAPDAAHKIGLFDQIFDSANFLERSLSWADQVIIGKTTVPRKDATTCSDEAELWEQSISDARRAVTRKFGEHRKAPLVALELLEKSRGKSIAEGFVREDQALAELLTSKQFEASIYAFNLLQKRAKKPAGAPDAELAKPVNKVGVIGAGLMASQFALLFANKLRVPVLITDLDQNRVDKGIFYIHGEIDRLQQRGKLSLEDANQIKSLVTGTVEKQEYSDCDWVIEAVFEELSVKQQVFKDIEPLLKEDAILATNTSSLSVTEIGSVLKNPARLIGFHFFNPVAVMPLIEVVKASATSNESLATALSIAKKLGKSAVITADRPGFVVNRLLAKIIGEPVRALDQGTDLAVIERSLDELGLPMGPFELIDLIGWKVAAHIQDTMVDAFGENFYNSLTLHRMAEVTDPLIVDEKTRKPIDLSESAKSAVQRTQQDQSVASTAEQVRDSVAVQLAKEIELMLQEGVVADVADIDLCMILGAGLPLYTGGISKYLDGNEAVQRNTKQSLRP